MGKHLKKRERHLLCRVCGASFVTGSSIKHHCSIECRIKDADKSINSDGCWEWVGSLNPVTGYGQLSSWEIDKRVLYTAHRVSFSAYIGPVPEGMYVLHRCDNRKCFNPEHLFAGSQSDNMVDMVAKNRQGAYQKPLISWQKKNPSKVRRGKDHPMYGKKHMAGESHPMSKLTESQALDIKHSKGTLRAIAEKYGVSQSCVSVIRSGKHWKHLNAIGDALN
jgi:hypothetical protein